MVRMVASCVLGLRQGEARMRSSLAVLTIALVAGCSSEDEVEGSNSLYMGHSYFRRQAEAMDDFAAAAGIEGHTSETFFRGGYNGSAFAIWDDPVAKQDIQDRLDAGDVEMLGMTIFIEADVSDSEGSHPDNQIQGLKNWISYAAENNPETTFFVGLPWLGGPLEYVGETEDPQTSGYEEYEIAILESEAAVQGIIDELREDAVDSEIFLLAYGQGSLELRTLYNQGNLPDVDTLVSSEGLLGIHSDTHGHAEQLLTDLNTLVWLASIYDVQVSELDMDFDYETDIKGIAQDVADRQDPAYTRQFR